MADEAGRAPPLRLNPFPHDGDIIRIDIRQIPQGQFGVAEMRQTRVLSRQPLQAAMGPHVNHCVRLPPVADPGIIRQIMVRRRRSGIVENLRFVLTESPGRLHRD